MEKASIERLRLGPVAHDVSGNLADLAVDQNHLIQRLTANYRSQLLSVARPVELRLGEILYESGKRTRYAYFPVEGFVSLVAMIEGSRGLEVGMVGREGMLGAHLALGVQDAPLKAVVQGAGRAWRVDAKVLKAELAQTPSLQRVLNQYVYVLMAQFATSAACQRFHQIHSRLARWLLMSQDRACSECFCVTQEFLAYMLGVRRVSITIAAGALQRAGFIEYRRGELTVLDRTGLEAATCGCYEADRRAYDRQLR